jgi:DNA repair exonuclease SbcCD ATPase subunit
MKVPAWRRALESRVSSLESALRGQKSYFERMAATDEEELHLHAERLDAIESEVKQWSGRIEHLERRPPRRGRPPKRRKKLHGGSV